MTNTVCTQTKAPTVDQRTPGPASTSKTPRIVLKTTPTLTKVTLDGVDIAPLNRPLEKVVLGKVNIPSYIEEVLSDSQDSQCSDISLKDPLDTSYHPPTSGGESTEDEEPRLEQEEPLVQAELEEFEINEFPSGSTMFVVSWEKLAILLKHCIKCGSEAVVQKIFFNGSMVGVGQYCSCKHISRWTSQAYVNKLAEGNLRLAAATLYRYMNIYIRKLQNLHNLVLLLSTYFLEFPSKACDFF